MDKSLSAGSKVPTIPLVDSTRRSEKLAAIVALAVWLAGALPAWAETPLVGASELRGMMLNRASFVLIDVRPPGEFQEGHIQGARNVPAASVLGAGLDKNVPVVVYCGEHPCALSRGAAESLLGAGFASVRVLDGGLGAWVGRGYPVEKGGDAAPKPRVGRMGAAEVKKRIAAGKVVVLDVRPSNEYAAGRLPGARSAPLEELPSVLVGMDKGVEVLVYDRLSDRSRKAAELLAGAGFTVSELSGGIAGWTARKKALEVK